MTIPSDWYVHVDGGNPTGPMPEGQLRFAIKQGRVPPTARVCRAGTSEWLPVGRSIFAREYGAFETTLVASGPEADAARAEPRRRYDAIVTLQGTVDLAAVLLLLFLFVPRGLDGGVRFAWSDLDKAPLLVIAPPALGLIVLIVNRLPIPALAKALVWLVGALTPVVILAVAANLVAGQVLGGAGMLLVPAFLFVRYLRFLQPVFRYLPIVAAVLLAVSYELPLGSDGVTMTSFALAALSRGDPLFGTLMLGPLALCLATLVVSILPPRGMPTMSRVVAFLTLAYGPVTLIVIGVMSALHESPGGLLAATAKTEWLESVAAAAVLFGFHAVVAAGIAGTLEAILGPQPDRPPPAPVLSR